MNQRTLCLLVFLTLSITITTVQAQTNTSNCTINHCTNCSQTLPDECVTCDTNYIFSRQLKKCVYNSQCPETTFYNIADQDCDDCDSSCRSCQAAGRDSCVTCVTGFYPIFNPNNYLFYCEICPGAFCAECDSIGNCLACVDGYGLNSTYECIPCSVTNCLECDVQQVAVGSCYSCHYSYSLSTDMKSCTLKGSCAIGQYQSSGSCLTCDTSCQHCYAAGSSSCYECKAGYYFSGTTCLPCDSSCSTCVDASDSCSSCPAGKKLRGHDCLDACAADEYYDPVEQECQNCPYPCATCTAFNQCSSCVDSTNYYISNGVCLKYCSIGTYLKVAVTTSTPFNQSTSCAACDPVCADCVSFTTKCTSCPTSSVFLNNYCQSQCPTGYYTQVNSITKQKFCLQCDYPCTSCNATACLSCSNTSQIKYFLQNGVCYSQIGSLRTGNCQAVGQYEYGTSNICLQNCPASLYLYDTVCECQPTCASCLLYLRDLTAVCTLCYNTSQFVYNGKCLNQCPTNTSSVYYLGNPYLYDFHNYQMCVTTCPNSLPKVLQSNGSRCMNCPTSAIWIDSTTCYNPNLCSTGQFFDQTAYKASLNNPPSNYSTFCANCSTSCLTCAGTASTQCLTCPGSKFKFLTNTTSISTNTTTVYTCVDNCTETAGYTLNSNSVCSQCATSCRYCIAGFVLIKRYQSDTLGSCAQSCPSQYFFNQAGNFCYPNNSIAITILNPLISGKISFFSALQFTTRILLMDSSTNNLINSYKCTLQTPSSLLTVYSNQSQIYTDTTSTFTMQNLTLSPNSLYTIACTASIIISGTSTPITLTNSTSIKTVQQPTGTFTINTHTGTALSTSFNVSISNWTFDIQTTIPLMYSLFFNYTDANDNLQTTQLLNVDSIFNANVFSQTAPLTLSSSFIAPEIGQSYTLNVYLTVYNAYTTNTVVVPLQIQENSNLQSLTSLISFAKNTTDLQTIGSAAMTLSSLFGVVNSNTSARINSSDLGVSLSDLQYIGFYAKIPCNDVTDCNSDKKQGLCKIDITSTFQKCVCNQGFAGSSCQFTEADFTAGQNFIDKLTFNISALDFSTVSLQVKRGWSAVFKSIVTARDLVTTFALSNCLVIIDSVVSGSQIDQGTIENLLGTLNSLIDVNKMQMIIASNDTRRRLLQEVEDYSQDIVDRSSDLMDQLLAYMKANGLTYYNSQTKNEGYTVQSSTLVNSSATIWEFDYQSNMSILSNFQALNPSSRSYYQTEIMYPGDLRSAYLNSFGYTYQIVSNVTVTRLVDANTLLDYQLLSRNNSVSPYQYAIPRLVSMYMLSYYDYSTVCVAFVNGEYTTYGVQTLSKNNTHINCGVDKQGEISLMLNITDFYDKYYFDDGDYWDYGISRRNGRTVTAVIVFAVFLLLVSHIVLYKLRQVVKLTDSQVLQSKGRIVQDVVNSNFSSPHKPNNNDNEDPAYGEFQQQLDIQQGKNISKNIQIIRDRVEKQNSNEHSQNDIEEGEQQQQQPEQQIQQPRQHRQQVQQARSVYSNDNDAQSEQQNIEFQEADFGLRASNVLQKQIGENQRNMVGFQIESVQIVNPGQIPINNNNNNINNENNNDVLSLHAYNPNNNIINNNVQGGGVVLPLESGPSSIDDKNDAVYARDHHLFRCYRVDFFYMPKALRVMHLFLLFTMIQSSVIMVLSHQIVDQSLGKAVFVSLGLFIAYNFVAAVAGRIIMCIMYGVLINFFKKNIFQAIRYINFLTQFILNVVYQCITISYLKTEILGKFFGVSFIVFFFDLGFLDRLYLGLTYLCRSNFLLRIYRYKVYI